MKNFIENGQLFSFLLELKVYYKMLIKIKWMTSFHVRKALLNQKLKMNLFTLSIILLFYKHQHVFG